MKKFVAATQECKKECDDLVRDFLKTNEISAVDMVISSSQVLSFLLKFISDNNLRHKLTEFISSIDNENAQVQLMLSLILNDKIDKLKTIHKEKLKREAQ